MSEAAEKIPVDVSSQPEPKPFEEIPGHPGWPVIGNTIPMLTKPVEFCNKWYEKYGPVSRTKLVNHDLVFLLGPEMNRFALLDQEGVISSKEGMSYFMEPFFKEGLVLKDGEEHQLHRGIMQGAFRKDKLRDYVDIMNPIIEQNMQTWLADGVDSAEVKFFDVFKQNALDIACAVFMGTEVDGKEGKKLIQAFQDTVAASVAIIRAPIPGTIYNRGIKARKLLEDYFYAHIEEKRKNPGKDLFSELCISESDEGDVFTDDDVVNHMIFLMMAAHDTTTFTTTRMVYHMAKHPEWQDKVREESRAIGKKFSAFDDHPQQPLVELIMKEALRMMAPVPGLPRKVIKDCVIGGYRVPAGTQVQVDMRHTHYMEDYWDEPMKFDPMRYADGGHENKNHRYAWLPFGGGVHKCIGRHFGLHQIKAALHQLVLNYEWSVLDDYEMPVSFPGLPVPKDHFPMTLTRLS